MPPEGEILPSWLRYGADDDPIATENAPEGKITAEQVRQYFKEIGVPGAEVEKLLSASGKSHEGGGMKLQGEELDKTPGVSEDRTIAKGRRDMKNSGQWPGIDGPDFEGDYIQGGDEVKPKPMFPGDRMGR